jgi:hypothetical protein
MRRGEVLLLARLLPLRMRPWLRSLAGRRAYRILTEDEVRATRRSDTLFVFGSGSSLNELTAEDWGAIAEHDTLGFNWFVHQTFVRCDYHLIRGIPDTDVDPAVWRPQLREYFELIRSNPRFAETVFLVHGGFRAINGNRTIGHRYLPDGSRVFRWRSNVTAELPGESFAEGLTHGHSTLQECVNFAYLLGWRRVVLVGVDLYDRRYFWLPQGEARSVDQLRGAGADDAHARAGSGMVDVFGTWREWLEQRGVELLVYNPRSLLAARVPVYPAPSHVR